MANAPGVDYKEMRFPRAVRCGLGGGPSTTNYDLSIEIQAGERPSVASASGAQVVATACPGCIVQLRDALHRYGR